MSEIKKLFSSNRLPALFVGAGMSKRYVVDWPTWDELLSSVAGKIGISKTQYYGMKQTIEENDMQMPKLASKIEEEIRNKVISGEFIIDDFLSDELIKEIPNNVSFLKLLVAQRLSTINLKTADKEMTEIYAFKKAIAKVNNIFTTNYDLLFDEHILNSMEYKVYDSQESLYFTNSFGIAEMYKIHGSILNPKTMIITEKDYYNYLEDMNLFVSKLYNTLIERPIVFIGYSLNDYNIKRILEGFIKHFKLSDLQSVAKNLIFIEHSEGESNLVVGDATFQVGDRQISMKKITTDNYTEIFNAISSVKDAISAREIKRYQDIVYDIIASHEINGEKVFIFNALDINKIDSNKMVLGIHPKNDSKLPLRGMLGIETVTIIEHALFDNSDVAFDQIASTWVEHKLGKIHYFPTYYIKKNISSSLLLGAKFNANFVTMEKRYKTLVENAEGLSEEKHNRIYEDFFRDLAKPGKEINETSFESALLLAIRRDISREQLRSFLMNMFKRNENYINMTNFKKAVCYLERV